MMVITVNEELSAWALKVYHSHGSHHILLIFTYIRVKDQYPLATHPQLS